MPVWGLVTNSVQVGLQGLALLLILLEIPIVFDVGGDQCGLTFTFILTVFHFFTATLRGAFRGTRLQVIGATLYYLQFLILPSLLLVHLGLCPSETLDRLSAPWQQLLRYATGPFALLEGFCSLIVIQAYGRFSSSIAKRSPTWSLVQLVFASLCITVDFYLLARIYSFPSVVDVTSATLIGAALMLCLFLGVYGIMSKKGNITESSLVFTYIVYVVYLTFTDFQSSNAPTSIFPFSSGEAAATAHATNPGVLDVLGFTFQSRSDSLSGRSLGSHQVPTTKGRVFDQEVPPLPPLIIDSYTSLMTTLAELTPPAIRTIVRFIAAAITAITPSVLISLVVRLGVFFLALRFVPFIRHPRASRLGWRGNPVLFMLYSYAPCIIIAVYTHLLIQHFGGILHMPKYGREAPLWGVLNLTNVWPSSRLSWRFWNWVNIFCTLGVYWYELVHSPPYQFELAS